MKHSKFLRVLNFVGLAVLLAAGPAPAALEWTEAPAIPLPAPARDVVEAPDGSRLYVLSADGAILILDRSGRLEATIPGPFAAERLQISSDGSRLFLAGAGEKGVQVISLAERFAIETAGSPFKGEAAAAVAVVVFSDFQ